MRTATRVWLSSFSSSTTPVLFWSLTTSCGTRMYGSENCQSRSPLGVWVSPGAISTSPSRTAASSCSTSGKLRQLSSTLSDLASHFINSTLTPDKRCKRRSYCAYGACNTSPTLNSLCCANHCCWADDNWATCAGDVGAAQLIKGNHKQPITHRQRKRIIEVQIGRASCRER